MTSPDSRGVDPLRHPLPAQLLHDLRTPLNQIIGYSEMLMEQAEETGQVACVPHLAKVRAAGYHLLALMNDNLRATDPRELPDEGGSAGEQGAVATELQDLGEGTLDFTGGE